MCKLHSVAIIGLFLLSNTGLDHSALARDSSREDHIMAEYAEALAVMEKMFAQSSISGTCLIRTYKYSRNSAGETVSSEPPEEIVENFDRLGDSYCKISGKKGVIGLNPDYSFQLKRQAEDKPLFVHGLGDSTTVARMNEVYLLRFLRAGFYVDNLPISRMLADKSFTVRRISEVQSRGHACYKIDYDYDPGKSNIFRSGWLVVSPNNGWCLIECESSLVGGGKNRLRTSVEYGEKVNGLLFPRHVQVQYGPKPLTDGSGDVYSRDECDFSELRPCSSATRDFTLMAYGFPDVGAQYKGRHANTLPYWLFGLALLSLLIALMLKHFSNKVARA